MLGWTWASARRRGTSHVRTGLPCQDALRCLSVGDTLVAVICDGAGSAAHGGLGAGLAAKTIASAAAANGDLADDDRVRSWIGEARAAIADGAARRDATPRDFATTLVACVANADGAVLALVGDGAVVVRDGDGWRAPDWPQNGEYASTTYFLTDEALRLRIVRLDAAPDAIALFSDGLERLALDFAAKTPHAPFFDAMIRPVAASTAVGRDIKVSRSLAAWLDSEAVNARTDDDKSLILAVLR